MEENRKFNWKEFGLKLLYPHIAVIICLLPISIACLVCSLIFLNSTSALAIMAYMLSFYMLMVICFRIPNIIAFCKKFKQENKFMQRWFSDAHLRINVSLYGTLILNIIFAVFQLCLGFKHKSFWFYSIAAYYIMLSVIRFFLVKHTRKYKANEQTEIEIKKYIISGWLLLFMNLALALIVFFMVYFNRTFYHHMITTIAMAAFTFVSFTLAIINLVKYRKYKSPIYSATKSISLISATVSILTLETTMLTTFGTEASPLFNQIMLSLTGIAVIAFAVTMAIIMLVKGNKHYKEYKKEKETLSS